MSDTKDGSNISGSNIYDDTFFNHLIDYWINFHHPSSRYFWWLKTYMPKLERSIWRKWVDHLLDREIVFERIRKKDT